MIITRTPLRISLGGGGTDLPSYYENAGHGFLIAAAISKYTYVAVNRNFDSDILLKYSEVERAATVDSVKHPLLRECLRKVAIQGGIEISSMADIPTGTGLGSSGSFTVGVLKALNMYQHNAVANEQLAEAACDIEINQLREPVGKQDQYVAALGGVVGLRFSADGKVDVLPLELDPAVRARVEENLLLFYTGVRRSASEVLAEEQIGKTRSSQSLEDNLNLTRDIGYRTQSTLLQGDLEGFGRILTEQWELKYDRQPTSTHDQVNNWIREGIQVGALGGKLVGAGGGGFLLFYADRKADLRLRMSQLGLPEVPFSFDYEGSTVLVAR